MYGMIYVRCMMYGVPCIDLRLVSVVPGKRSPPPDDVFAPGHTDEVNAIKWDPSGNLLASCSDDYTAKVTRLDYIIFPIPMIPLD